MRAEIVKVLYSNESDNWQMHHKSRILSDMWNYRLLQVLFFKLMECSKSSFRMLGLWSKIRNTFKNLLYEIVNIWVGEWVVKNRSKFVNVNCERPKLNWHLNAKIELVRNLAMILMFSSKKNFIYGILVRPKVFQNFWPFSIPLFGVTKI